MNTTDWWHPLSLFCFISCTEVQSVVEAIFSRHNFVCHQLNATNSNNLKCYLAARIKSLFFVFLMSPTSILSPLWFLLPVSCIKMASETLKSKKSKTEQPKPLWLLGCHLSFVVLFCFKLIWHPLILTFTQTEVLKRPTFFLFFLLNCNQWASSNTPISSLGPLYTTEYQFQLCWGRTSAHTDSQ